MFKKHKIHEMTVFRHWTMGSRRQWLLREWRQVKWNPPTVPVCCLGGSRDLPQGRETQTEPKGVPAFSVWGGWGSWKLQGWTLGRKGLIRELAFWRPLGGSSQDSAWVLLRHVRQVLRLRQKTWGRRSRGNHFWSSQSSGNRSDFQ